MEIGVFSEEGQHLMHIFADSSFALIFISGCFFQHCPHLFLEDKSGFLLHLKKKPRIRAEFLRLNPETNFDKI